MGNEPLTEIKNLVHTLDIMDFLKMDRRTFMKAVGAIGAAVFLDTSKAQAADSATKTAVEIENTFNSLPRVVTVAKTGTANFACSNYKSDDLCIQAAIDYAKTAEISTIEILDGTYTMQDYVHVDFDLDIIGIGYPVFKWTTVGVDMIRCSGTIAGTVTGTSDIAVGATTINISSAEGVVPGDLIVIYNDVIWNPIDEGYDQWKTGEIHEVAGINGKTVTFYDGLLNAYTVTNNLSVQIVHPITINISGIKINGESSTQIHRFIGLTYCKDSSIHNCVLDKGGGRAIGASYSLNINVYNNKISHCEYSGNGYGVSINNASAHALIHDNVISSCRHCTASGGNFVMGQPRDVRVYNNVLYSTISHAIDAHPCVESIYAYNNIIHGNETKQFAFVTGAKFSKFSGNILYDCFGAAIRGSVKDIVFIIENNTCYRSGYMFYDNNNRCANTERSVHVTNNKMYDSAFYLFMATKAENIHIANNTIDVAPDYYGIYVQNATSGIIANNEMANIWRSGITLIDCSNLNVSGNILLNCCQYGAYGELHEAGFALRGTSTKINVSNNTIRDSAGKMKYAIKEYGTADNNIIKNNILSGATVSEIVKIGANTQVSTNVGYVTEVTGTATITAGQTSVTVTHGLVTSPTRVILSPTSAIAGKQYYVSAKTASTFTITIDSTHTSDITFDWEAAF